MDKNSVKESQNRNLDADGGDFEHNDVESDTWSYTIMGNDRADKLWDGFLDVLLKHATREEFKRYYKGVTDTYPSALYKLFMERSFDMLVELVFFHNSHLAFQVLGVLIMKYGAKMPEDIKVLILEHSRWEDECCQLENEQDKNERKKWLLDFRERVKNYENGVPTKVPSEVRSTIHRPSINYQIIKYRNEDFKVNDFITLRLVGDQTQIYIDGEYFIQCKYLLLDISVAKIRFLNELESIDEAAEVLDNSLEHVEFPLAPHALFWGHCSNLQAWYEYNYDTRLLHRNLAFPLLKKLSEVGDPLALRVFQEEIARRYSEGVPSVKKFLEIEGYLEFLSKEQLGSINIS